MRDAVGGPRFEDWEERKRGNAMRMMFGLVLVVGLALAGFAVYMAQGYINKTETALQEELRIKAKTGGLVEVYVVNKPMNYGDLLTKEDVQLIYWAKNALPETAFMDEAILFPEDGKKPRYILRQIEKFEPVLAVKVTEPGQPAGLTGQLGAGMVAFSINVDVSSGVSGFLQPGDRVDVYWTGAVSGVEGEMTRLIQNAVSIIAIDQNADGSAGGAIVASTVTIAATRENVARLVQAQATGALALSLVGQGEIADAGVIEVDSKSLLGIEEQQVAEVEVVEAPKVCSIKTRKGGEVTEIPIPCTN